MGIINRKRIGFIVKKGFRGADIIGVDAVLRFHPRNKIYFIGEQEGMVQGQAQLQLYADTNYKDCPELDVLIVGEMDDEQMNCKVLQDFVLDQAKHAECVLGISKGVEVLYKSGLVDDQKITADKGTIRRLQSMGVNAVQASSYVEDGKIITAGPSTGAIEAAFAILNKLRGKWLTKFTELTLEYNPYIQFPLPKNQDLFMPELPKALRVGLMALPGVYYPDEIGAQDVFAAIPNTEFYYLSKEKGKSDSMIGLGASMQATTKLIDCPQLDVLVVGAMHPKYITDEEVQHFIKHQVQKAKAVISVCAGTFTVGATGVLEGKNATTNYQQISSLPLIGVACTEEELAVDGKFYSAGPAIGSYQVALKAVEQIVSKDWAQYIEHEVLEFSPEPVFGAGSVATADSSAVRIASCLSKLILNPYFNTYLKKKRKK